MPKPAIGDQISFIAGDKIERHGVVVQQIENQWKIRTPTGTIWRASEKTILSIQDNPVQHGSPSTAVNDPVSQNQEELQEGIGSRPGEVPTQGHSTANGEPRGASQEKGEQGGAQHSAIRNDAGAANQLVLI